MRCCRQSSSASAVAERGAAECSARAPADMAPSRMRCATPMSGRPPPATPGIWASSSVTCPTCRRSCALLTGAENSIERWWQKLEAAQKYPEGSQQAHERGCVIDLPDITYYVGHETVVPGDEEKALPRWVEALFAFMHRNSAHVTEYFKLPVEAVVEIGREVSI